MSDYEHLEAAAYLLRMTPSELKQRLDEESLPDRVLGYEDASAVTGLSVNALRHRVSKGTIPFRRLGPRSVRFSERDLESWMRRTA